MPRPRRFAAPLLALAAGAGVPAIAGAADGTTAPAPPAAVLATADPPGWVDPFAADDGGRWEEDADLARPLDFAPGPADKAVAAPPTGAGRSVGGVQEVPEPAAARVSVGDLSGDAPAADGVPAEEPGRVTGLDLAAAALAPAVAPGFGDFCPVAVRDDVQLIAADDRFAYELDGVRWRFHSAVAKAAFRADPDRYRPVAGGRDVVLEAREGFRTLGRAELAVLYRGRLFLFRGPATRAAFAADPTAFVTAGAPGE